VRERKADSPLDLAKSKLRAAIKSSGVKAEDYAWVAKATPDDVEKIEGLASALSLGKELTSSS
jgi:hypothetical protein